MQKRNGFTLIELMIVIAIIAIIAAIAIPSLIRSRISANEASAAGGVRTISTAEFAYQASGTDATTTGVGKYATLTALGNAPTPFIDSNLATGIKSGYTFQAFPQMDGQAPRYTATGTPIDPGKSGLKTFFVDETGLIRFEGMGATPTSTSPPLN